MKTKNIARIAHLNFSGGGGEGLHTHTKRRFAVVRGNRILDWKIALRILTINVLKSIYYHIFTQEIPIFKKKKRIWGDVKTIEPKRDNILFHGPRLYKVKWKKSPYSDQSVRPSVLPSICPSEISCPGHIFSPLDPIWLILHPQSASE